MPPADQQRPTALALRCGDEAGRGERAKADAAAERLLERRDVTEDDLRPILPDLLGHGREDLAVRFLERLQAQGLASADAQRQLGLLYEGQKQLDRARATLERAAAAQPASVDLLVSLARVAQKQRDYRGALGYLAHARSLEPSNAGVHFFFGMVCIDLDLGVEAFDSLKEAVRLEPDSAPFNYALGAVALHRRDPGEAIPFFKKYAELRPADARGPFAIGAAAFQAHDFPLARTELQKAAAHAETSAGAHYFLARIAREEGDLDEGVRLAQKAVAADPRYADPYAELGILYIRKRETDTGGGVAAPLPRARPRQLPRQLSPSHALPADQGRPRGGPGGPVRGAQGASRAEGGRVPASDRGASLLSRSDGMGREPRPQGFEGRKGRGSR